ncbi:MAG: DUF1552 domain-containing protein [Singulisphaera sp.]
MPSRATASPDIAAPTRRTSRGGRPRPRWPRRSIRARLRALFADEVDGGPTCQASPVQAEHPRLRRRGCGPPAGGLGTSDRRKIDEYDLVRELEVASPMPASRSTSTSRLSGRPASARPPGHIRLMCDLMVLAFQGDVTRIATFMYANEASNRSHPTIGVPEVTTRSPTTAMTSRSKRRSRRSTIST